MRDVHRNQSAEAAVQYSLYATGKQGMALLRKHGILFTETPSFEDWASANVLLPASRALSGTEMGHAVYFY
eukprot:150737-Rhodomonas_salina.2